MDSQNLLKKLCLASGISGNEEEVCRFMKEEVKKADDVKWDNTGSIAFYQNGTYKEPKILLVAHMDEIGFVVNEITKEGLIKLQPVGGWNNQTLLSSQLKVITSSGEEFRGTIGCLPPHYLRGNKREKQIHIKDMFLDIGFSSSKDLGKSGISLGDPVVPDVDFVYFEHSKRLMCKAFDDRVGIAAVIETLNYFSEHDHPNVLVGAGSVQEEVGARGASTLAELVKPQLAIIIEGAPADDLPGLKENPQTAVGNGVHIRLWDPTMIVHNKYKQYILKISEKYGIKYQKAVRESGGTDAKIIHLSKIGVPSIVLGVPVRYAHSHRGIISLDDYQELLKFLQTIIVEIDKKAYNNIIKV